MKIYVVNYKETDKWSNVESGICEVGYTNEADAIKKCCELSDEKMNEFSDDIDEEREKIESGEMDVEDSQVYHETNDNNDWQLVKHYDEEYEYWVTIVDVDTPFAPTH